ncbi:MAG TPA: TIM44-like domain-containing protein [Rhodopila sp.]|nr:TIM44-like domain-containing protein [Rhodopila sp.]
MTYSAPPRTNVAPYSAQPMQRSFTPNTAQPGYASPYRSNYSRARSPFMSGLMGGLIGAGIGGLLFGHGFMGHGLGFFGLIGLLLQLALIYFIGRFLFRTFLSGRAPMTANGPGMFSRGAMGGAMPGPTSMSSGGGSGGPPPINIGPSDYQQFEQLLKGIQAAWTAHDLNAMQAMATPEMVSYFSEQLSDQVSRGVRNTVADVRLLQGDLSQAWAEGPREYATVAMRFSMVDVTQDMSGRIVDGDPNEHVTATELWTFVRSRGGHWILSAIQQAR